MTVRFLPSAGSPLRDDRGVGAVEFALIAPVLLMLLAGIYDLANAIYIKSLLEGAMHQSGRNSTIEGAGANAATIDQRITQTVKNAAPGATLTFSRKSYSSFTNVSRPEDFTDVNNNGVCDHGEPFEDANDNGLWDADRGRNGQGSARDAVLYRATLTYQLPFPVAGFVGLSNNITFRAETVLRNQPYNIQTPLVSARNCP